MSSHRLLSRLAAGALFSIAAVTAAFAGPYADFERALASTYAPYRAALFQTNTKDKTGAETSLANFEKAWSALMQKHRTAPPPQYADDPKWAESVASVDAVIAKAKAEVAKGDLATAHDTLEAVRDRLGELRQRNGVVVFSDRLDAYHHHMEVILLGKYDGAEGPGRLREDAAVLVHLADVVQKNTPPPLAKDENFKQLLAPLVGSAKALLDATRSGDREAIGKAMKGLKPAYAKLFVKFG